jgi:hypothetical protein
MAEIKEPPAETAAGRRDQASGANAAAAATIAPTKKWVKNVSSGIARCVSAVFSSVDWVAFGTLLLAAATAWLAFVASNTDKATHELANVASKQLTIVQSQLDAMNAARQQTDELIKSSRDSADVARRALAIGQRPWVYPELATEQGVKFTEGKLSFDAKLILKNVGNSPAINVNYYASAGAVNALDAFDDPDVGSVGTMGGLSLNVGKLLGLVLHPLQGKKGSVLLREFCEANSQKANDLGDAIFPDRDSTRRVKINLPKESTNVFVLPVVIVCLTYRSAADQDIHRTGFVFSLRRKDSFFLKAEDIPPAQLLIETHFSSGSIAD